MGTIDFNLENYDLSAYPRPAVAQAKALVGNMADVSPLVAGHFQLSPEMLLLLILEITHIASGAAATKPTTSKGGGNAVS